MASAISDVNNDARFRNGPESGQAFLRASTELLAAGRSCSHGHRNGDADPRCAALFSAAADARATSVALLTCTAPDVFDTRAAWKRYLPALSRYVNGGGASSGAPRLPPVPSC